LNFKDRYNFESSGRQGPYLVLRRNFRVSVQRKTMTVTGKKKKKLKNNKTEESKLS
jgi:hypothetical protein